MPEQDSPLDQALREVREHGLDPESPGGAVALSYLLTGAGATPPHNQVSAPVETSRGANEDGDPAAVLGAWAGVGRDEILDIFEFGDGPTGIGVSSRHLPRSKAECQRALVVLKLAAERVAFSRDAVPAGEVNNIAAHYGVLDQNLASNVAIKTNLVARRGKRGSWTYRITQPGLDRAKQVIEVLANGEDISEP
jgi:hypothetical protein